MKQVKVSKKLENKIVRTEEVLENTIDNLKSEFKQYSKNGETQWASEVAIDLAISKGWLKTLRMFATY